MSYLLRYLYMTSILNYIKCLQNVSCFWDAKLESKKTLISYDCDMLWKLSRNNYLYKQTTKLRDFLEPNKAVHCTKVRFASFLSGGFTTMAVINPPKSKLAKCTSVHWFVWKPYFCFIVSICISVFVFSMYHFFLLHQHKGHFLCMFVS